MNIWCCYTGSCWHDSEGGSVARASIVFVGGTPFICRPQHHDGFSLGVVSHQENIQKNLAGLAGLLSDKPCLSSFMRGHSLAKACFKCH